MRKQSFLSLVQQWLANTPTLSAFTHDSISCVVGPFQLHNSPLKGCFLGQECREHEFFWLFSLPWGKWGPLHRQLATPAVTRNLQHYITPIIYLCIKKTCHVLWTLLVKRLGVRISESQADAKTQGDEGRKELRLLLVPLTCHNNLTLIMNISLPMQLAGLPVDFLNFISYFLCTISHHVGFLCIAKCEFMK